MSVIWLVLCISLVIAARLQQVQVVLNQTQQQIYLIYVMCTLSFTDDGTFPVPSICQYFSSAFLSGKTAPFLFRYHQGTACTFWTEMIS